MSSHHNETINLEPISEVAKFYKNLVSTNIPESYELDPTIETIACAENIRKGVIAFRDFLHLFFDRLITDGHMYAKPPKKPSSVSDYPFIGYISNLLCDMGYHGNLAESGDFLLATKFPSCTASVDEKGKAIKPLIPASNQIECFRFLALCGFVFTGIDLEAKKLSFTEMQMIEVSYPSNPIMLTGLKALSIADIELRTTRRYKNDDSLLRCEYMLLKAEDTNILDVLINYMNPLPEKVKDLVVKLHQHNIDMGMTCVMRVLGDIHFAYSFLKNNQRDLSITDIYTRRVWGISISMRFGYCLVIRPKKTDKYTDAIKSFPPDLQEIIVRGYGCDRKLRDEICQWGCQGIRIPLDESILDISGDIEAWLGYEMSYSIKK